MTTETSQATALAIGLVGGVWGHSSATRLVCRYEFR